ncbi:DUF1330 domain-containing protein [Phaeobacter sp. C3_T13_0]|uniref:DUF1330 domain-containing protein n=1 Tax=Phaeobacter cretensis TaxID=3342641 RepID=UPI0039BD534D
MTKTVLAMTSMKVGGSKALEQYLFIVGGLMEAAGARLISRYEVTETLCGSEPPHYVSIIEYPNDQAIRMVFDHPDYRSLEQVKDLAFSRYDVCVVS